MCKARLALHSQGSWLSQLANEPKLPDELNKWFWVSQRVWVYWIVFDDINFMHKTAMTFEFPVHNSCLNDINQGVAFLQTLLYELISVNGTE